MLNYQTDNIVDAIKEATGGHGANIIYDPVGGDVSSRAPAASLSRGVW